MTLTLFFENFKLLNNKKIKGLADDIKDVVAELVKETEDYRLAYSNNIVLIEELTDPLIPKNSNKVTDEETQIILETYKHLKLIDQSISDNSRYDENLLFTHENLSKIVISLDYLDREFDLLPTNIQTISFNNDQASILNESNIKVAFLHHFTYRFLYSVTQPITHEFIEQIGADASKAGVILAFGPIAALCSTFIFLFFTNRSYYWSLISCSALFIFAFIAFLGAQVFESIALIGLSRFLVGLGSSRIISKRYLSDFSPQNKISEYSFTYVITGAIGLALGPIVTLLCAFIPKFETVLFGYQFILNEFTYPGLISLMFSLFFLLYTAVNFTDPYEAHFNIYEDDCEIQKLNNNDIGIKSKEKTDKEGAFEIIKVASIVIFSYLALSNSIVESLLVSSPSYFNAIGRSSQYVSIVQSVSLVLVYPISLSFQTLTAQINDRRVIMALLCLTFIFCLLISGLLVDDEYLYLIWFFFLLNLGNLLESVVSSLFAKILPKSVSSKLFNAGLIIILFTTIGKTIGSILNAFCSTFSPNLNLPLFLSQSFLALVCVTLGFIFYGNLRVRSIDKLMKRVKMNKSIES